MQISKRVFIEHLNQGPYPPVVWCTCV